MPEIQEMALSSLRKLRCVGRRVVGERVHLHVSPEHLDRVEFGSVGREELEVDPPGAIECLAQFLGAVTGKAVPHDDEGALQVAPEIGKEAAEVASLRVLPRQQRKVKSYAGPARREGECADHRDFVVGSGALVEDRCLTARRPGAAHQGRHQEPGLVDEDQARVQPAGFFLTRGQTVLTHVRMASSSRSRARRSGFCGLQPIPWRSRPT